MAVSDALRNDCFTEHNKSLHLETSIEKKGEPEYDGETWPNHTSFIIFSAREFKMETLAELVYTQKFILYVTILFWRPFFHETWNNLYNIHF